MKIDGINYEKVADDLLTNGAFCKTSEAQLILEHFKHEPEPIEWLATCCKNLDMIEFGYLLKYIYMVL